MGLERKCPSCDKRLTYVSRKNLERANRLGGRCKSCGLKGKRVPDLVGLQFGKLNVLKVSKKQGTNGNVYWDCKCVCGSTTNVVTAALRSGGTSSCGCTRKLHSRKYPHPKMRKQPFESLYNVFVKAVKRDGKSSSLTYEEFLTFTAIPNCHYCENPLVWCEYNLNGGTQAYNLDRTNNDFGYSKDNCVACCLSCNRTKGNRFSYGEFRVMMHALVAYRKQLDTTAVGV